MWTVRESLWRARIPKSVYMVLIIKIKYGVDTYTNVPLNMQSRTYPMASIPRHAVCMPDNPWHSTAVDRS